MQTDHLIVDTVEGDPDLTLSTATCPEPSSILSCMCYTVSDEFPDGGAAPKCLKWYATENNECLAYGDPTDDDTTV